jgi:hypothetical protein
MVDIKEAKVVSVDRLRRGTKVFIIDKENNSKMLP